MSIRVGDNVVVQQNMISRHRPVYAVGQNILVKRERGGTWHTVGIIGGRVNENVICHRVGNEWIAIMPPPPIIFQIRWTTALIRMGTFHWFGGGQVFPAGTYFLRASGWWQDTPPNSPITRVFRGQVGWAVPEPHHIQFDTHRIEIPPLITGENITNWVGWGQFTTTAPTRIGIEYSWHHPADNLADGLFELSSFPLGDSGMNWAPGHTHP